MGKKKNDRRYLAPAVARATYIDPDHAASTIGYRQTSIYVEKCKGYKDDQERLQSSYSEFEIDLADCNRSISWCMPLDDMERGLAKLEAVSQMLQEIRMMYMAACRCYETAELEVEAWRAAQESEAGEELKEAS